jgi:hypothetical protein
LLDKDYLSLAEVQVMGVDPLRFAEVDVSSALNNFGGWCNVQIILIKQLDSNIATLFA